MKRIILLQILFTVILCANAQNSIIGFSDSSSIKLKAQVDVSSFFDNTEFGGCSVQNDQTMAGVRFTPKVGAEITEHHEQNIIKNSLYFGTSLMQPFGDNIDSVSKDFIAYYKLEVINRYNHIFHMGVFPLKIAIEDYPRIFFQDSILFYRPTAHGFSYKLQTIGTNNVNTLHLWLNWTGKQSDNKRETFFIGWQGKLSHLTKKQSTSPFFVEHIGYLFHYAKTKNAPDNQFIHDNIMTLTRIGLNLDNRYRIIGKFNTDFGYVSGIERDRGNDEWLIHNAFLWNFDIAYHKSIELTNSLYLGNKQMKYYTKESNNLYWGDPIYRSKFYNRTDLAFNFLNYHSKWFNVGLKMIFTLHIIKQGSYVEQALYSFINIGK